MKKINKLTTKELIVNIILYAIGIIFMPLGVVLTINAHLGAGGYDALNFALGNVLGINTSFAIYMTAFVAIIIAAIIRKSFPKLTTFISSFFLGIFTEIWKAILSQVEGKTFVFSFFLFAIGMIIIAFAVASYVISIFPSNPTDDLIVALTECHWRLGTAKVLIDCVCVVGALLLGGEIGIGTVVCTFGLGPIIDIFYRIIKAKVNLCIAPQ